MNEITSGNNALAMYTDPAAVSAAESAKARIQAAFQVALYKRRNYEESRINILNACRRPEFAEKAEYSKPVSGNRIVGPSIRFAELALREWGNILYENQVIYDDEFNRRVRVTVIDLQTNVHFGKEVQITKTVERKNSVGREVLGERLNTKGEKVYIVKATDDEVNTFEAAQISKALRNEGLRLIPQEIIEEAIATAREALQSRDKKDPDAAKKRLTDIFAAIGIMPTDLEKYLNHPIAQCTPNELQDLRGVYTSIKEGSAKWVDYVTPVNESDGKSPDKVDKNKEKLLGKKIEPLPQQQSESTQQPQQASTNGRETLFPEGAVSGNGGISRKDKND